MSTPGGNFAWYLDLTMKRLFSCGNYPIPGKDGLPLCKKHGYQLELKKVVVIDDEATKIAPPDHCWACDLIRGKKDRQKKRISRRLGMIGAILVSIPLLLCIFLIALPGTKIPELSATSASTATGVTPALAATATTQAIDLASATTIKPVGVTSVEVDFLDVGQGDSILVTTSDGKVALIDGGEQGSGVIQHLQSKNIHHIDLMIATHPDSDHIGGLVEVLNTMPVSRVVTNGQPHTTQLYEDFLDGIARARAEYVEVKRGDILSLGSLCFQVLNPATTAPGGDMNNNSVVLRLMVGQVTFLFTGDAQVDAEAGMIGVGLPLKADILKVGHHGSRTSSSPAFLAQIKPAVAVYMAGAGNQYGYPHAETIDALTAIGAQIYGTDTTGTIAVTTDGNTYQVRAQGGPRAAAGRPPRRLASYH